MAHFEWGSFGAINPMDEPVLQRDGLKNILDLMFQRQAD
jgi:hypothetical protein